MYVSVHAVEDGTEATVSVMLAGPDDEVILYGSSTMVISDFGVKDGA